ncbi:LysM peptidoglycan-binding domain-containing protein [Acidihalobacter aeolianus]|uniref:LysM peptidoglycan-binding domain-containing protein n=1 Tax=Acidihalobacter aeolianus TaxID=2792603 RepID=UPI000AC170DC|nr:LysM peptidoglycan-binding domain-containing protein [Acidihalobacter aeolianus]
MLALRFRLTATAPASLMIVTLLTAGCASAPQKPAAPPAPPPAPAAKPLPPAPVPAAQPIQIKPTAPKHYVVKKGDTLWDIAKRFLNTPWNWPEIWYDNPHIKNPHWIYPGDVLTLYYVNGQPRISVTGGPRVSSIKTVVLKPSVEYQKLPKTEHPIPIQTITPFLVHPRVVPVDIFDKAPHIVAAADSRILYDSGNRVYVRGLKSDAKQNWYSVYRPGGVLKDPKTGEVIGHQVLYLGDIHILKRGRIATGILEHTREEVTAGDRLLPLVRKHYNYTFMPTAPKTTINAQVIALFNSISMVGQYQVVVLDTGTRDGLRRGDVLAVDQYGRMIVDRYATRQESRDVRLPNQKVGLVMVFRTFKRISYALVMSATDPIMVGDLVHNP